MPLAQEVIYKYIEEKKKNRRKGFIRRKKKLDALFYYEINNEILFPSEKY